MARLPESVSRFLSAKRVAVAGVSRDAQQPANAIFRRLRDSGRDVVPINPQAASVEGTPCYADVLAVPGSLEAVMIAAPPVAGAALVRQCAERGVRQVWFHRAIGAGSVAAEAVALGRELGVECIVGGCPLMYCAPVDVFHRCLCAVLRWRGKVPR